MLIDRPIIEAEKLSSLFQEPNLIIFDARAGKDAFESYLQKHIKGAQFIDLEKDLAAVPENAANGGRHPLPDLEKFRQTLENFGVNENSTMVVYDDKNGANAAARLWWMLVSFGFEKAVVLDCGLQNAEKNQIEMATGEEKAPQKGHLKARFHWNWPISTIEEVKEALSKNSATVIDVRDAYRYRGESEPIDLVAGHIPGAVNVPFSENLDENGRFLSSELLNKKYSEFLKGKTEELIIHCGSGVTACHTILALKQAGFETPNLYVGSWSEWSRRNEPIATEI